MLLVYFGIFSKYIMYIVDLIINVRGILISMNILLVKPKQKISYGITKGGTMILFNI